MDTGIVGRDRALAATAAFLDEIPAGSRALILEGDAGIGKTVLWRAGVGDAARAGYRVLEAVAEPVEARMSFVSLADLLDDCYDAVADGLPTLQRDALDHALLRRSDSTPRDPDNRMIGTALRSALVALARTAPVVIAIDDAQWLDDASAEALAFAARRLGGTPVGLLLTARTPPAQTDRLGLRRAMGEDGCVRVRLGPLGAAELQGVLHRRLGFHYLAPVLRRVAEVSEGNPLFALEIARALGPAPVLPAGQPLPVPGEFHELVASRVARLSDGGHHALLAAAALSHPTTELIERIASPQGLEDAEQAGLLDVAGERVAFTHPLYASAVYAAATSRRRRGLHGELATLVGDPEERARHLALATARPDPATAAAIEAAAGPARSRGGWSAAAQLLEEARRLTPIDDPEAAARRAVRAAEHHMHAGDRPRARALLEETIAALPSGSLRSDALRLLADVSYNEQSFFEAERLLRAALAEVEDPALAVSIELTLAYVTCNHLGDYAGADPYAEAGLQSARELGNPGLIADALAVSVMVGYLNGRGVDWDAVAEAAALEDPARVGPLDTRPAWIAALLRVFTGRLPEARTALADLRGIAERSGDESDVAQVLHWMAWVEGASGELAAGLALGQEALAQAGLAGSEQTRAWALAQLTVIHAQRGDVAQARATARAGAEICETMGSRLPLMWIISGLGLLELSLGDAAAAWAALEPLTELVERNGVGEAFVVFLPAAIEALIGLGELDRAQPLLDDFEARGRALDRVWARALGGRCRALLLAERGDLTGAQAALDEAAAQHRRMSMPFELARTLLVDGQIRRRARARGRARQSLQRALDLFSGMGAEVWAGLARAELDRMAANRGPDELTAAEHRIAVLAADGLSNKEIAASLFVSVHTVEVHLSHVYAKLAIRSRVQLNGRVPPLPDAASDGREV